MTETDTETFTDPEDTSEAWIDVRMTDPEAGEWDVDAVIVDGRVQYVDLRIRPELLASFVDCLVADVSDARAEEVFERLAAKHDLDIDDENDDATTTDADRREE